MGTQYSFSKKRNWIDEIFRLAEKRGEGIEEDKLIAEFCRVHGSTRRTCKEILKDLIISGRIFRYKGDLLLKNVDYDEKFQDTWTKLSEADKKALRGAKNDAING